MISYIKGRVLHKTSAALVVLSGDMGYEVSLPANRLLQYSLQQEVELYTYLLVREDLIQLCGFESWEERELFLLLVNVSGIGPKGALSMIGQSSVGGMYRAIAEENIAFLTKMPGIGKKTAQRLVLELKDKLPEESFAFPQAAESASSGAAGNKAGSKNDIFAALVALGYHENEIRRVYPQLQAVLDEGKDEQAVIKKALQLLAKI